MTDLLSAEEFAHISDWQAKNAAYGEALTERDALAAELAELLAGLASIFANLDNPEKHSIFDSFAHEDRLRTLASQPQGELGKALLAVVEAARRKAPIRQPHDPACRCVDCELFLTLAVIYGAQP